MLKLSIITINYNNAAGLRKTIESVVDQTSTDFEYIVIDGASTDGSMEIIKEYDNKIRYWISEPDSGIYNAMNKGIKAAKGEYCQFLNSGDALVSNDITEKALYNAPEASLLLGNMLKLLPSGKIYRDRGVADKKISLLTFYQGTINHSTSYIKRHLFETYGLYDEDLRIVSDWKWFLQVFGLNNEKLVYQNLDISLFDMQGVSNTNSDLVIQERKKVLKSLIISTILTDYEKWSIPIRKLERINRFWAPKQIFWLLDRLLLKFERISTHPKIYKTPK